MSRQASGQSDVPDRSDVSASPTQSRRHVAAAANGTGTDTRASKSPATRIRKKHSRTAARSAKPDTSVRAAAAALSAQTTASSLSEQIANSLEREISDRHLTAGTSLGTKTTLVTSFGVAPATINEALQILRQRGTVTLKPGPHGGVFVLEQSPLTRLANEIHRLRVENLINTNDAAEVLDGLDLRCAHDAVRFRTDEDVAELTAIRAELVATWNTEEGTTCNWALHRRIADITPNRMLRSFYQNLVDYIISEDTGPALGIPGFDPGSDERLKIHLMLVDAIIDRNDEAIDSILAAHRGEAPIPTDQR